LYEVLTMSEQGKVGACPSLHLTQVKAVLHEENTTSVGHDRGGGLAVRARRCGPAVLRGSHGQPHGHGYCYRQSYRYCHG
jgi:hypothetical protein